VELSLSIGHWTGELAGSHIGLPNSLNECSLAFEVNTVMLMRIKNSNGKFQFMPHNLYRLQ